MKLAIEAKKLFDIRRSGNFVGKRFELVKYLRCQVGMLYRKSSGSTRSRIW